MQKIIKNRIARLFILIVCTISVSLPAFITVHADEYNDGYNAGYDGPAPVAPIDAPLDYKSGFLNGQGDADDDDAAYAKEMEQQEQQQNDSGSQSAPGEPQGGEDQ